LNKVQFDPIWEEKYSAGHQQKAPWDSVVSFVYRFKPKQKNNNEIKILEVGCGTASNLWFFALESFDVTGIEASASAIQTAKNRFQQFSLRGQLDVGSFTNLPYEDNSFDLVIDRGALCCVGTECLKEAISEISRVIKTGGKFLYTPFSEKHSSFTSGQKGGDDLILNITKGSLVNVGQIRFCTEEDIKKILPEKNWQYLGVQHIQKENFLDKDDVTGQWNIIVEKK
jgi:ubiquinone/menaquinone biosynthesis C-methylase UbiE